MKGLSTIFSLFMMCILMNTNVLAADTVNKNVDKVVSPETPAKTADQVTKSATPPAPTNNQLPSPVGKVIWVKGTFKATMPNKEVRVLQKDSIIYLHDTLTTENASQAQIAFTDNSLMTFRADTKFVIDQYAFQPKNAQNKGVGKYVMSLVEGGFRTITGLIAKDNPDEYKVNTPVATIGVRGTDYKVYVHNGGLYVGYIEGSPCVTSANKELCLDSKTPYANVPDFESAPVPITTQPEVLRETLQIVPATVGSFVSPAGTVPSGKGGTVNSFCIQ